MITLAKLRSRTSSTTFQGNPPPSTDRKFFHRRVNSLMCTDSPTKTPLWLEVNSKQPLPSTPRRPSSSHGAFPLRSALKQPSSPFSNAHSRPTTPNLTASQPARSTNGSRPQSSHGAFPLRSVLKQPGPTLNGTHSRPTTPNAAASQVTGSTSESEPQPSPKQILMSNEMSNELTTTSNSLLSVSAGYTHKVSFDTFETPSDGGMFSYTLQVKTEKYSRSANTRVFLCAASNDESGKRCLEWALEDLAQNNDELIVLRGFDMDALDQSQQSVIRQEAHEFMNTLQMRNKDIDPDRQLSLVVEFVAGKITQTIERLIALYRPDSLIVGTRGQRGKMQTWGAALHVTKVGQVSKWCLSHSPVPVIVVRPERKVRKTVEKRRADPKRGRQFQEKLPGS